MKELVLSTAYKRDYKLARKRKRDLSKLEAVLVLLVSGENLPASMRDHALTGSWKGSRDCHIQPDWILIYQSTEDEITLLRMGSHSDLLP